MPRLPKQLAISVLLLLAVTLIVLTARPKPFRPYEIVVERGHPPGETLAERLAAVDTTEWLRRRIPGLNRTIRAAYPVTEWTLEVVEALKPA